MGDLFADTQSTPTLCSAKVSQTSTLLMVVTFNLYTCLSYIYDGALPAGTTVPQAQELMTAISTNPKLTQLVDLCKTFIGSYDLKQRMYTALCLNHTR